jgi:hypothetical protein
MQSRANHSARIVEGDTFLAERRLEIWAKPERLTFSGQLRL